MANCALLALCLLLAVGAVTAMATTAAGGSPHRRLQQLPKLDDPVTDVPIPSTSESCWKSILSSESCVHDIVQSLVLFDVRVSKVCCSVLEKIGDKCVLDAFSNFPFNPFSSPIVKRICGLAI